MADYSNDSEKIEKFCRVLGHSEDVDHYFLHQEDTPTTYSGYEGQGFKVKSDGSGIQFATLEDPVPIPFTGLTDTPTTYSGFTANLVSVDDTESNLVFTNTLSGINAIYPTEDGNIANKKYVDDIVSDQSIKWFSYFINDTPSKRISIMGKSANGFNPGYDIRILELHLQYYSEHTSLLSLRVRVYRYDAGPTLDRLLLSLTETNKSIGYQSVKDTSPDINYYDLDSSACDTIWIDVDDGSGSFPKKACEITVNVKYKII